MRLELAGEGHLVHFLTINSTSALNNQTDLLKEQSFALMQDQTNVNVWTLLGGHKDDFFIYDKTGKLKVYLSASGSVDTDLSTASGYGNLKTYILNVLGP